MRPSDVPLAVCRLFVHSNAQTFEVKIGKPATPVQGDIYANFGIITVFESGAREIDRQTDGRTDGRTDRWAIA